MRLHIPLLYYHRILDLELWRIKMYAAPAFNLTALFESIDSNSIGHLWRRNEISPAVHTLRTHRTCAETQLWSQYSRMLSLWFFRKASCHTHNSKQKKAENMQPWPRFSFKSKKLSMMSSLIVILLIWFPFYFSLNSLPGLSASNQPSKVIILYRIITTWSITQYHVPCE